MQEREHQAVPQFQDQVPIGVQEGEAPIQEAEDHLQGDKAQLVYVKQLDHCLSELTFRSVLFGEKEEGREVPQLFSFVRLGIVGYVLLDI